MHQWLRYVYLYGTRHGILSFCMSLWASQIIYPRVLLLCAPGPEVKASDAEVSVYHPNGIRCLTLTTETVKNIVSIASDTLLLAGSY